MNKTLHVDLGSRTYPIHIGTSLLSNPELLSAHTGAGQIVVITNDRVGPLYGAKLRNCLGDRDILWIELPDGERFKTLDTVTSVVTKMLEARIDRSGRILALGGGVVGDIAGFCAAIYQRGIDFVQIPTTLLAQVDSSVGGKTGVNHPLGKNMIGAFHQPRAVFIDIDTLQTLPPRELSAGLAEVIKYGLIQDIDFFTWLENHIDDLLALNPAAVVEAVYRSCACKAEVVAADERESGRRAILNLGHTFGHAIEAGMGYGVWLHGEAVGTGMAMAARMSEAMGWLDSASRERAEQLLTRAGLDLHPPAEMTSLRFHELMAIDKKVRSGQLHLVLLQALGSAVVTRDFDPLALELTLRSAIPDHPVRAGVPGH